MKIPPGRIPPREPEPLTELEMHILLPHLVNLTDGLLSATGAARTTRADVDRIFDRQLPEFVQHRGDRPTSVVFYAHGGLVDEQGGLRYAVNHVQWWKDNGVYPVFFVWETGLRETLCGLVGKIFEPPRHRALISEITDKGVEELVRRSGGGGVWGRMKEVARVAAEEGGGSRYVAEKLASFRKMYPEAALHAVGHSAGAIFHSHFIPAALDAGVDHFGSLNLLAPAVRIDHFQATLLDLIGDDKAIRRASIFTMKEKQERDDTCALGGVRFYRKSLLYLIHYALEPRRRTQILGLAESFAAANLNTVFQEPSDGSRSSAEIIWSDGREPDGRPLNSRCDATSHDAFDNNRLTMESVARRVTGRDDIEPYPQWLEDKLRETRLRSLWADQDGTRTLLSQAPPGLADLITNDGDPAARARKVAAFLRTTADLLDD